MSARVHWQVAPAQGLASRKGTFGNNIASSRTGLLRGEALQRCNRRFLRGCDRRSRSVATPCKAEAGRRFGGSQAQVADPAQVNRFAFANAVANIHLRLAVELARVAGDRIRRKAMKTWLTICKKFVDISDSKLKL